MPNAAWCWPRSALRAGPENEAIDPGAEAAARRSSLCAREVIGERRGDRDADAGADPGFLRCVLPAGARDAGRCRRHRRRTKLVAGDRGAIRRLEGPRRGGRRSAPGDGEAGSAGRFGADDSGERRRPASCCAGSSLIACVRRRGPSADGSWSSSWGRRLVGQRLVELNEAAGKPARSVSAARSHTHIRHLERAGCRRPWA